MYAEKARKETEKLQQAAAKARLQAENGYSSAS